MKIDYTNLSFTELIDKIEANRFFDLPRMVREAFKRLIPQEPKYKVYTAILNQLGTDAPVATILENTLEGDIIWTYSSEGVYIANLPTTDTPISFISNSNVNTIVFNIDEPGTVTIVAKPSVNFPEGVINGEVINTPIEIRVYN